MADEVTLPSPGGWAVGNYLRVLGGLVIGTLLAGGGYQIIYGTSQGAQAAVFCEAPIVSATKNTVTVSCLNPLPVTWTGAIVALPSNGLYQMSNTAPKSKLNICTATGAAQPCLTANGSNGTNVGSGIDLTAGSKRWLALSATGAVTLKSPIILAPSSYPTPAKNRLNFTWVLGSGATTNGLAAAFARIAIMPCNLSGVGC